MLGRKTFSFLVFFVLFISVNISAQVTHLPRSTPEAEGVSSSQIIKFIDAAEKSSSELHSFMVLRHGKVIAEGWWDPYRPDLKHTLYSCSKSFTATAIGFAVQEKLLSVNDKVISFFPDELPDTISPFLSGLTIKHVLIMSDGQDPDPTFPVTSRDSNWVKGFLATPIVDEPGTKFLYNSLGTYMLSAIIQKVTGQKLIDYLTPRLFEPLGITGMDWETDSRGINTGGWGLRLKTEDMAKFVQLFLQKGKWSGKQLLAAGWIEEASSMHIMQDPNAPQSKKDSSDWLQGYGYQMWRCRHNAYRGDGAYGQFMIVIPEHDAVVALTAESEDLQGEIDLVWDHLLPAFKKETLPANEAALKKLRAREKSLILTAKKGTARGTKIRNKTYNIEPNEMKLKAIGFDVSGNRCTVSFQTDTGAYNIAFGKAKWKKDETDKPGPSLLAAAIENTSMIYPAKIAASYAWTDKNTLQLVLRYIESPHSETYTCRFNGDNIDIDVAKSLHFGKHTIALRGRVND
jgi:CubicO group peptidase (beta-lactamase class C family)